MKKLSVYILMLILVIACNDKKQEPRVYTIQGEGIGTGTAYLLGTGDAHNQFLTIDCKEQLALSIPLEIETRLSLVLPNKKVLTLFAAPGITATLQPDSTLKCGWSVNGGYSQHLHDSISRILDTTDNINVHKKVIDEFAKEYPFSEVIIELFRRYLVEIPDPDKDLIRKSMDKLGGAMQDHEYFANLRKQLDEKIGNAKNKLFPSFKYATIDQNKIDQGTFSNKYLLVTFWDPWNSASLDFLKKLEEVRDSIESESFDILNVAIGNDTARIRTFVEENGIIGHNTYDTKGMNSDVLESFNITSLPFSVLVTPYKRIEKYQIELDSSDIAHRDSLVLKHDKKQKK